MYRPYRGQRAQRRRRIRNCILVLLALLVVAAAVFLLFFQERMVYSSDGVHFDLWGKPAGDTQDGNTEPEDVPFQIEDGSGDDTQAAAPAAPKLLEIPAGRLSDAAYLEQVKALHAQGAINGAAIVVKDPGGALLWNTAFAGVQGTAVVQNASDALPSAVQALRADGLPVTAVLYAYQDDLYASLDRNAALIRTNNNVWRAADQTRRLDPASDAANAYLAALLQELSGLGVDETVLRGFGWPAAGSGRLDRVRYGDYADAAARSAKLLDNLAMLQTAAGDMKISVCVDDPTAENGVDQATGQDLGALSQKASRVYVPMAVQTETSGDSIRTIVGRVPGADPAKLVPMYDSAELAPSLFAGSRSLYFSPSATNGEIGAYVTP